MSARLGCRTTSARLQCHARLAQGSSRRAANTVLRRGQTLRAASSSETTPRDELPPTVEAVRKLLRERDESVLRTRTLDPCAVAVQPWEPLPTLPHILVVVRELERRYGRIREFYIPRVRSP